MFTWSNGTTVAPLSWGPVQHASGGCRRHRTSPTIPSEPPSLAHPTRRAAAAEKGGPSLWWARVIEVLVVGAGAWRVSTEFVPAEGPHVSRTKSHLNAGALDGRKGPRDPLGEPALHIV